VHHGVRDLRTSERETTGSGQGGAGDEG